MTEFLLAFALFLLAHMLPARPGVRAALIGRLGERLYLVLYSALSLGLLVWLISAIWRAPYVALWPPAPWQHGLAIAVMPLALALFGAGVAVRNPLSINFLRQHGEAVGMTPQPGVLAVTRHPVLWGFALWAAVHLLANGDAVSVLLFGGLGGFALAGMPVLDRRRRRQLGAARWAEIAAGTSVLPLAAVIAGRARPRPDARSLIGALLGLAVYAALLAGGHLWLFGVDPLAGL